MATNSLSSARAPFNPSDLTAGLRSVQRRDPVFWSLHRAWRAARDAWEASPAATNSLAELDLREREVEARVVMFGSGLDEHSSATALLAKLEAVEDPAHMAAKIGDLTLLDLVRRDLARLSEAEIARAGAPAAAD